jgi:hypothetical protein
MRTIFSALILGVLALSATALAQPACPEDVEETIAAACPCAADGQGKGWLNHGKYVSCVVRLRNDLRRQGCLDSQTQRLIARCASRSTCGKEGAVLCCTYDTSGVCSDPAPGDLTAAGTCSNDVGIACDTNADCVTVKGPKVKRHAETCTLRGGTVVGTGSVCAGCPALPPAP